MKTFLLNDCVGIFTSEDACGGMKIGNQEFQGVVSYLTWVLGIKIWFPERLVSTQNSIAFSLAPIRMSKDSD